MLKVSNGRLRVLALKKAQTGDEVIVRLVETDGKAAPAVQIGFAGAVASAHEVNGAVEPVRPAPVTGEKLVTSFTPFRPRRSPTIWRSAAPTGTNPRPGSTPRVIRFLPRYSPPNFPITAFSSSWRLHGPGLRTSWPPRARRSICKPVDLTACT